MGDNFRADAELISAYTRAQAILDGVLVPITDLVPDEPDFARQAGFMVPVALTSALAGIVIPTDDEQAWAQDTKGRLWDLLNMSRFARPRPMPDDGATWLFKCIFYMARDGYRRGSQTLTLKTTLAPGDEWEPVVTFMLASED